MHSRGGQQALDLAVQDLQMLQRGEEECIWEYPTMQGQELILQDPS